MHASSFILDTLLNEEKVLLQNYGNSLQDCRRCIVLRQEIKQCKNMTFAIKLRPPQHKVSKNLARNTFVRPCRCNDSSWIENFSMRSLFTNYCIKDLSMTMLIRHSYSTSTKSFHFKWFGNFFWTAETISYLLVLKDANNLIKKKKSSIPLIIENPVRSPMVPPIRLSCPSNLIFVSRSISSNVAVSK